MKTQSIFLNCNSVLPILAPSYLHFLTTQTTHHGRTFKDIWSLSSLYLLSLFVKGNLQSHVHFQGRTLYWLLAVFSNKCDFFLLILLSVSRTETLLKLLRNYFITSWLSEYIHYHLFIFQLHVLEVTCAFVGFFCSCIVLVIKAGGYFMTAFNSNSNTLH